ncbi:MAG: hypothetical protein A2V66_16790 [Ignavibacteria bacterium RBG_13_36_8]|nr:MAG: hypothetical protein A2V66_16790 [Ignavibacteria bacterium RBG_13_36_8]
MSEEQREIIKQRSKGDCGICALAMFLNISYDVLAKEEEFQEDLKEDFGKGASIRDLWKVAKKYGYDIVYTNNQYFKESEPAIVFVPSLKLKGKIHSIYWDGERIFDPSNEKTYESLPDKFDVLQEFKEDEI